jgi:hypothetical protein
LEPGILELDLTDPAAEWQWICPDYEASRHLAIYTNGTRTFRTVGDAVNGKSVMEWDKNEATLGPPDDPFVWDVTPDAPFGLNNPNTILNTPRLHSYDIVRIHQTRDVGGKVNDAYRVNAAVPPWYDNVTLEGVVKNGIKPVLYTRYTDWSEYLPTVIPHLSKMGVIVEIAASSMTIRNIMFLQTENDVTPDDLLSNTIPSEVLNNYQQTVDEDLLEILNLYYDKGDEIWDFAQHHNKDPALWLHAAIRAENNVFRCTGIGMTVICVTSAIRDANLYHNRFDHNYIGILALETEHDIAYNEFRNNYLAGVVLDKGARAVCRENLFIGNGHDLQSTMANYQGGIWSHFCVTTRVPNIQTPVIYNNTFVNNKRALSVTEHSEYRSQMMNRPFFFNNIISGSAEPIHLPDSDHRCDLIGSHNCFYDESGIVSPFETEIGKILTSRDTEDDPEFGAGGKYLLTDTSPCLNTGLFTLYPGIMSELKYFDYGMMDIGYHHLVDPYNLPGSPENLQIDGYMLSWDPSYSGWVNGYLVLVETYAGNFIQAVFRNDNELFYDFSDAANNYDHLFLWVMAHIDRIVYSDPVMIEWME